MNRFDHQWRKLITLARQAREGNDPASPFGFATRVASLAATMPPASPWIGFERVALRGLLVAAALGVAAIAFDYSNIFSGQTDEYALTDPVGEILDLS